MSSPRYRIDLILPNGTVVPLEVDEGTFILDAAREAGLELPYRCLQGWCVTCAGQVENGSAACCVDQSASLRYYPQDAEGGFVLLCTARPKADCRIRTHQAPALRAFRRRRRLPTPLA